MAGIQLPPAARLLATSQDGVLSRAQLAAAGVDRWIIRNEVRARRWALRGDAVVMHRGPLTQRQREWVSLLHAGRQAVLGGLTAATVAGLTGYDCPAVHVVTPKSCDARPLPWTVVHETRVLPPDDLPTGLSPPRTSIARSVVDAAAWQQSARWGCALVAAAVRQRLVLPGDLRRAASARRRYRHRGVLLAVLGDIEGGAEALSEIDFAALCRANGLPPPHRQVRRIDRAGRVRYLDAEWVRADGGVVVAEIDGAVHLEPVTYWEDMRRQNDVALTGRTVLRFPAVAFRTDPDDVVRQLRAALA